MIICKIKQGLGNQLFQYAAARSLSLRHNAPLLIDTSYYLTSGSRKFELHYFNIPELNTNLEEHAETTFNLYKEPHFHYDPFFNEVEGNIYLDGFWQSEKYFKEFKNILMQELKIKEKYVSHLREKAEEIKNENSVAIHIRRGDYLSKKFSHSHGVLPPDYYLNAIDFVAQRIAPLKFYFFSDDVEWLKTNFRIKQAHEFISENTAGNSIEDFYLMSQCKHQIIANSSFSWWAAWLNGYTQKQVITPAKWFNNLPYNTADLIPQTWIRI